jgi:hypothetical protein
MAESTYILAPIGIIHSDLTNRDDAQRDGLYALALLLIHLTIIAT